LKNIEGIDPKFVRDRIKEIAGDDVRALASIIGIHLSALYNYINSLHPTRTPCTQVLLRLALYSDKPMEWFLTPHAATDQRVVLRGGYDIKGSISRLTIRSRFVKERMREVIGFPPSRFARDIGIPLSAVYNYLAGRIPDTRALFGIARHTRFPMEWFLISGDFEEIENDLEEVVQKKITDLIDFMSEPKDEQPTQGLTKGKEFIWGILPSDPTMLSLTW